MAIETLDDVIEEILDVAGIYGAHTFEPGEEGAEGDTHPGCEASLKKMCRVCASSALNERIRAAIEVERKLRD
jgi:hypothetical protein